VSARRESASALVAGALSVFGFAPFGLAPIPILTLAYLIQLWQRAPNARTAAWLGFAFGLGLFLAGVSWVYVSLNTFGGMPLPIAVVATVGFCAYLALFPALAGALQAALPAAPLARMLLVAPAAWTLTEWLRSWLLTGFPWLGLGYSQTDAPLRGYAPLAGAFGLTLATAFTAGALAAILAAPTRVRAALVLAIVALHTGGGVLRTIEWTRPVGSGLDVALLQGNVSQDMKWVPGRYEETLATYQRLVESTKAQLIVLPETALPRFFDAIEPEYLAALKAHVEKVGGNVLVGAPTGDPRGVYYNSIVSLGTAPPQVYSKAHLVPFGEFVPPGFGWVVNVLSIPLSDFARGRADQRPLALGTERVAINICYEDTFGTEIIRQLPEATMLVNVSNVAWFGDSLAPAQHLEISRMRAFETGRPMLRATNTGVTAIVDHRTGETQRLPGFTEGVLAGRVQGYGGATPYVRAGDTPAIALAVLLLVAGVVASRGTRGSR
jgi:apolipoprotein N-acyltransferase